MKLRTRTDLYLTAALLAGLMAAQTIGTIQVYLSNGQLHQSLSVIHAAGYLVVPNQKILPNLPVTSAHHNPPSL